MEQYLTSDLSGGFCLLVKSPLTNAPLIDDAV